MRRNTLSARRIRPARWALLAVIPVVVLAAPSLIGLPARLLAGCPTWVAIAALFESVSILGFVVCFCLVFGEGMTRRQAVGAALRALGATTLLPAGGLVGPAIGVQSATPDRKTVRRLLRSTIAFTILTAVPSVAALVVFGSGSLIGWPGGPDRAAVTIPAAALASALLVLLWVFGRSGAPAVSNRSIRPRALRPMIPSALLLREAAAEARHMLSARNWTLIGPVAYYGFDNAVLWAAFHAYGKPPHLAVVVMGYLVGSLAAAIPVPAGLGVTEGGLIGALVVYGAPAAPAASAVLLYRGISLALAVLLGAGGWTVRGAR